MPHKPVLLNEILESFSGLEIKVFVDGTLGAGGHAEALLAAHPEIECYLGIDQDPSALEIARERLLPWQEKVKFQRGNFSDLTKHLAAHGISQIDAVLLDLGVSSMQLDRAERGFSLMRDGPLDMRMDPDLTLSAFKIINTYSEQELGRIFKEYGEEKRWRAAARVVTEARAQKRIQTTLELVNVLTAAVGRPKRGKIHPATLIFQGLRLVVNQELERVEQTIPKAISCLRPGGRLAIISFHSLEDRIVKQSLRYHAGDKEDTTGFGGVFITKKPSVELVTRKPIAPSDQEIDENPRCRSAKLRVAAKL